MTAYILTALSACLGNVISSIIAGNMIGADAVSAINLSKPVTQFYYTLHLLLTAGSGMLVAYALGRNSRREADTLFTQALCIVTAIALAITLFAGVFFSEQVVLFFCKNRELYPMSYDYMRPVLLGAPLYILISSLNTMVAVDGEPRRVSMAILVDNAVNLLLAPLFIGVFHWGVTSSSVAVIIGHAVGILILLSHWRKRAGEEHLQLRPSGRIFSGERFRHILSAGAPLAVASICLTILLYSANSMVLNALGRSGIFVFSVAMNLLMLYNLFLSGSCQTLQSLGAIQVGKQDCEGLRYVIHKTLRFMTMAMLVLCVAVCVWPEVVVALFGGNGTPELLADADHALRIFAVSFIPFCYIYIVMIIFKLLKHDRLALFISFALSLTVVAVMAPIAHWAPQAIWWSYLIAYGIEIAAIYIIMKIRKISLQNIL